MNKYNLRCFINNRLLHGTLTLQTDLLQIENMFTCIWLTWLKPLNPHRGIGRLQRVSIFFCSEQYSKTIPGLSKHFSFSSFGLLFAFLCLPFFHSSCGFYFRNWCTIYVFGFLKVCAIHLHFPFISSCL